MVHGQALVVLGVGREAVVLLDQKLHVAIGYGQFQGFLQFNC